VCAGVEFVRSFVTERGEELKNVHLTSSRVLLLVAAELSIEKTGQIQHLVRSLGTIQVCPGCGGTGA
jgi:hypothetical protein